jgi:transposase InsO family protein
MTVEARRDAATRDGAIARTADQLGINRETLRNWVTQAEVDAGTRPGTTTDQAQRLAEAGAVASVGTTGDSYDNALAEAFHSLFKAELVRNRGPWKNLDEVEIAVAEYVDWFNHRRLHGEIGLVPPTEFEDDFYQRGSASTQGEAWVPSLQ